MTYKFIKDRDYLHIPTNPVATLQEGEEIAKILEAALACYPNGIGISANQIGIRKSVSIIRLPKIDYRLTLINPVITFSSPEKVIYSEGCVSLPGKIVTTLRSQRISVETLNHANVLEFGPDAEPLTAESIGEDYGLLKCICAQHEIGHLNGQLIVDDGIKFTPQTKQLVKYGRNDKVVVEKNGETQYIKYKRAIDLVKNDGWKLI